MAVFAAEIKAFFVISRLCRAIPAQRPCWRRPSRHKLAFPAGQEHKRKAGDECSRHGRPKRSPKTGPDPCGKSPCRKAVFVRGVPAIGKGVALSSAGNQSRGTTDCDAGAGSPMAMLAGGRDRSMCALPLQTCRAFENIRKLPARPRTHAAERFVNGCGALRR